MRWLFLLVVLIGCHTAELREIKVSVSVEPGDPVKLETTMTAEF